MRRPSIALFLYRLLYSCASSFFTVFIPILLYQKLISIGYSNKTSISLTLVTFALYYLFSGFTSLIVNELIRKFGSRVVMIVAVLLNSILYFTFNFQNTFIGFLIIFISQGVGLIFWWHSYNILITNKTSSNSYAKLLSLHEASKVLVGLSVPLISGYLLSLGYENQVLYTSGLLMILSLVLIPFMDKATIIGPKIKFLDIVRSIEQHKTDTLAFISDGFANGSSKVVWSLVVFAFAGSVFSKTGILVFIVGVASLVTTFLTAKHADKRPKKSLKTTVLFLSLGYFIKVPNILMTNIIGEVITDSSRTAINVTQASISFNKASSKKDYSKYLVAREFSLGIGRFIGLLFFALIIYMNAPINTVFLVSGFVVLGIMHLAPSLKT